MKTIHIIILSTWALLSTPCMVTVAQDVVASRDELLSLYDSSNRVYTRLQIDTVASYFHQRMLGEAIVERDYIRYQINVVTKKLIDYTIKWREDIPAELTYNISQHDAEARVKGEVEFSNLYFISPESVSLITNRITLSPCWVIRSKSEGRTVISIIDANTGEFCGFGTPPPDGGFSIAGPDTGDCPQPPIASWMSRASNAQFWFTLMGYPSELVGTATESQVQSHVQSDETAVFFELDHGGSTSFHNYCDQDITATEIETWIEDYSSMPFSFIASCGGLCDTGEGTFANEFSKGNNRAALVGYCHMDAPYCNLCWLSYSLDWQSSLFANMATGATVNAAFNQANLDYPTCALPECMRFAGDPSLTVVPVIKRSYCGNIYNGQYGPLSASPRGHFIRCDAIVPGGQNLTISSATNVIFLNDSKITANGNLNAVGTLGQTRLISETDNSSGIKISGQVKCRNGGQIKILEH